MTPEGLSALHDRWSVVDSTSRLRKVRAVAQRGHLAGEVGRLGKVVVRLRGLVRRELDDHDVGPGCRGPGSWPGSTCACRRSPVLPTRVGRASGTRDRRRLRISLSRGRDLACAGRRPCRRPPLDGLPGAIVTPGAGRQPRRSTLSARRGRRGGRRPGRPAVSSPTDSRTSAGSTASGEPSADACVIRAGCSISDSTAPSDSASVNSRVRATTSSAAVLAARGE